MYKKTFRLGIQIFLSLILMTMLFSGCTGNSSSTNKEPPKIPPQSTFVMDFSDFTQNISSLDMNQKSTVSLVSLHSQSIPSAANVNALGDRSNWTFAALNVGFWNLAGFVGLAIPVTAFVESIKQTPVKQPDGSWIWTYSITVAGTTYTAELHGKYISSGVRWDMYISKQNEYTDFLWYYGESDTNNTKGYWVLKDKPSNPNDFLRIDWQRNPTNETGDIKYTNIVPGGAENGGYISFEVSKGETYNSSYVIFNKGKNETTYIEWSSTTKAGHAKDPLYFKDSNWHCWDSNLNNITCQ
jgi:hypothetical protein